MSDAPPTRSIWKFPLKIEDGVQKISMPIDAVVVHVSDQVGGICMWAEVVPSLGKRTRFFQVYGTGHPIEFGDHVGTAFIGGLVWHVYEISVGCMTGADSQ